MPRPESCEYFEVKNFKQFQHYSKRNPPWVRLYYSLLDDEGFLTLDLVSQRHYIILILIASRCDNKIRNNKTFLKRVMRIDDEPDLTPLFERGFLLALRKRTASKEIAYHDGQNHFENSKSPSEAEVQRQKYRGRSTEAEVHCIAEQQNGTKKKTRCQSREDLLNFEVDDDLRKYAKVKNLPNPDEWVEEFKDYWLTKTDKVLNQTVDWRRSFQNRLRFVRDNPDKFSREKARQEALELERLMQS